MKLTVATFLVTMLFIAATMNGVEAGQSQQVGSLSATKPLDSWIRWFLNRSKQFGKVPINCNYFFSILNVFMSNVF